jgi:hypothetical protein
LTFSGCNKETAYSSRNSRTPPCIKRQDTVKSVKYLQIHCWSYLLELESVQLLRLRIFRGGRGTSDRLLLSRRAVSLTWTLSRRCGLLPWRTSRRGFDLLTAVGNRRSRNWFFRSIEAFELVEKELAFVCGLGCLFIIVRGNWKTNE